MRLGKIGKGLTAALVGGVLLWPTSSAEKPSSYNDYHPMPGIVYAAEATKPAYKGIPNQTGGQQYNYKTTMPVTVHYKQLPAGVDKSRVMVLDPNDKYHYLYRNYFGKSERVKLANGIYVKGDLSDAARKEYPDMISIEQLNGAVIKPGEEHVIFVDQWFEDFYTKMHEQPGKIWYDHSRLGGTGDLRKNMAPMVQLRRMDTGRRIHVGNTRTLTWVYTKPQPNEDEYYGTVDNLEIYTKLKEAINGVPSGRYVLEFFDSLSGSGHPLLAQAEITIENPNGVVDPKKASGFGLNYDFVAKGEAIPWYMITPYSTKASEGKHIDLHGVVKFDLEGSLPKNDDSMSLTVYTPRHGWMYTNDTKIGETTVTKNSHEITIDTTRLPNGDYDLVLRFDSVPEGSHTNPIEIPVRIQNQPMVASQPNQ